ncbi:DUF4435 domain-containing protein [Mucilaginibacter sp. McL0603]|uniref:DUF4435 domain-containing protein n=1 Tax=Mucilaginibacter sp. McL0603 TaxID=3415670 RepID=UPI003CEA2D28
MISATDLILVAKNSATTAYHKFVLLSNRRETDLFCFFEGQDSKYYSPRIKAFSQTNYHPIICGNKQTVIKTFQLLDEKEVYKKYKKLYFIDRDFDEKNENPHIYETPCYSIENLYCQEETLIEILKNEFSLTEEDREFHIIIETFRKNQKDYHSATALFNAWYAVLKCVRNKTGVSTNVSLDESLPKDFILLKIGELRSNYDLQKIKETFPDALTVTDDDINKKEQEFLKADCSKIFRGKFEMHFFYKFLLYLIEDANKEKKMLKKKTSFSVSRGLLLSQICQYAITPSCLNEYLKLNIGSV